MTDKNVLSQVNPYCTLRPFCQTHNEVQNPLSEAKSSEPHLLEFLVNFLPKHNQAAKPHSSAAIVLQNHRTRNLHT